MRGVFMNKKKFLMMLLITFASFCIGTNKIFALTPSGDCSAYFTYNDVVYNEGIFQRKNICRWYI